MLHTQLILQPPEIAPAGLETAVVAVVDELPEGLLCVFRSARVLVVLDTVHLDATVVLRKGLEVSPSLLISLKSVQHPVLKDK